jgi:hypothetical protein
MVSRRDFLLQSMAVTTGLALSQTISSCQSTPNIKGGIMGANATLGHKLRLPQLEKATKSISHDVVIIGGGIAGLSAARQLKKSGIDFVLMELENRAGGNSISGENSVSPYPWGAHYLPLPNLSNKELLEFLQEVNVITSFENGIPVFNDLYLCFDPKERLYLNEHWQEGIIPHDGVPQKDQQEILRFLSVMDNYRNKIGRDQRFAFNIPVEESSTDLEFTQLDLLSMSDWLAQNNFRSAYLVWYVNYCCRDDFGALAANTSAWAGIHYFASRKGKGKNVTHDVVLTWPEGNGWLAQKLKDPIASHLQSSCLVRNVEIEKDFVKVLFFNEPENEWQEMIARQVILATPQFINQYLIKQPRSFASSDFEYAPWMVANLTVNAALNEKRGEPLAWDNVIYQSDSLGYVNASHQRLQLHSDKKVITYYKPLVGHPYQTTRKQYQHHAWQNWVDEIIADLKKPHRQIETAIEEAMVWRWGHGMISPPAGFMFGKSRRAAQKSFGEKIFFAHSDLSGISIFEEAFYWGNLAAKQVLKKA